MGKILTKQEAERVIKLKQRKLNNEILKDETNLHTRIEQDIHQQGGAVQSIEGQRAEDNKPKKSNSL